jgi:hypothetical protein
MNTHQEVKIDERTVAVADRSSRWALNFISFALLLDIMYRAAVRKEAAWDLFALLGVSGAISIVYLARHEVLGQLIGWKVAIIALVVAGVVAAVAAVILTATKAM